MNRDTLIRAFKRWNSQVAENPEAFTGPDDPYDAESQADYLLGLIEELS